VPFDGWQLDWKAFDADLYAHYQTLSGLRRLHAPATGSTRSPCWHRMAG
jgi:hypothetical protein